MRSDTPGLPVVLAAVIGLAMPPSAMPASAGTVAVTLCGGGTVHLALGGRRVPGDAPGACHAVCAVRRDDEREGVRDAPA